MLYRSFSKLIDLDERTSTEVHLMVSCMLAVVVMFSFAVFRCLRAEYTHALFNLGLVLMALLVLRLVLVHRKTWLAGTCLSTVFVIGLPAACYLWGAQHAIWAFPGLLGPVFFLPSRWGLVFIAVGYLLLVPILWLRMNTAAFIPTVTALLTNLIFAASVLRSNRLQSVFLTQQSFIDPLTRIGNRRAMRDALEQALTCTQFKRSLCIIDLDHFKRINDRYGHMVGDKGLLHIVALFQKLLPSDAGLYRYGGEEFVVLLAVDQLAAKRQLQAVLRMAQQSPFHDDVCIEFSAGVAEYKNDTIEGWLSRADTALLAAKRQGRGQVCVDE